MRRRTYRFDAADLKLRELGVTATKGYRNEDSSAAANQEPQNQESREEEHQEEQEAQAAKRTKPDDAVQGTDCGFQNRGVRT